MLQHESILEIIDNSGAKKALIIGYHGGIKRAGVGDVVSVTVKKSKPNSIFDFGKTRKKGEKKKRETFLALIVATKHKFKRKNNTWISSSKNCGVIVSLDDEEYKPFGTRIFIPLLNELDCKKYKAVMAIAPSIV